MEVLYHHACNGKGSWGTALSTLGWMEYSSASGLTDEVLEWNGEGGLWNITYMFVHPVGMKHSSDIFVIDIQVTYNNYRFM